MNYEIINTAKTDLEFVYFLFEEAIKFQKRKNYTVWKGYDKKALEKDVEKGLQYKIVANGEILCVFSVCYSDKIIWRDKEQGNAIYIHRAVVTPKHRGQKLFAKILKWTINCATAKSLDYIRMDTWDDNPNIVEYYKKFGFNVIEYFTTPDTPDLPTQHRNLGLILLQYSISKKL